MNTGQVALVLRFIGNGALRVAPFLPPNLRLVAELVGSSLIAAAAVLGGHG